MAFGKPAGGAAPAAAAPNRAAATAAARPTTATPGFKPTGGKYSALRPAAARHQFLTHGTFALEVVKTFESYNKGTGNKWFHADCLVLESDNPAHPVGSSCTYLQCITEGPALDVGGPKVITFIMNCVGYEESREHDFYEAFGGDAGVGSMIDAASGVPAAVALHGENPMAGYRVRCSSFEGGSGESKKNPGQMVQYYDQSWSPYAAAE